MKSPQKNNIPNLPNFSEKIPELISILKLVVAHLKKLQKEECAFSAIEKLSESLHSLKGVSKLLPNAGVLAVEVVEFYTIVDSYVSGNYVWKDYLQLTNILEGIYKKLEKQESISEFFVQLRGNLKPDLSHEERLKKIPTPIYKINSRISKKALEAINSNFEMCILEEDMQLNDFISWDTRLQEILKEKSLCSSVLIYCSPQLLTGDSTKIQAIAWLAFSPKEKKHFEKRLECSFPEAEIKKNS